MPITWKTVVLAEPQQLQFGDCEPIVVERADERLDLRVSSSHGAHCVLEGVVDTDERFHDARITVFTGSDPAEMFLFEKRGRYPFWLGDNRTRPFLARRLITSVSEGGSAPWGPELGEPEPVRSRKFSHGGAQAAKSRISPTHHVFGRLRQRLRRRRVEAQGQQVRDGRALGHPAPQAARSKVWCCRIMA